MRGWIAAALLGLVAIGYLLCAAGSPGSNTTDLCEIRAVLNDSGDTVQVGGELDWLLDGKPVGSTTEAVTIKRMGEHVKALLGERGVQAAKLIAIPRSGHCRFNNKQYRGRLELFVGKAGGLVVLNVLPLEDYLLGVVPAEMPSSWPDAALQAQAVAARTYALRQMLERGDQSFDVYATVDDQVYNGVGGEHPRTTAAIRATVGQVVTYDGKPIVAYFCSDAGGCTKCGNAPYLQAVPIQSPDSPHNQWQIKLTRQELSELLARGGHKVGTPLKIETSLDGSSGHLLKVNVIGDAGKASITGAQLRKLIGLKTMKSTRAWIEIAGQPAESPYKQLKQPVARSTTGGGDARMESVSVQLSTSDAATQFERALEEKAASVPPYSRPFVAYAGGIAGLKLRSLYVSDGTNTTPANRDLIAMGIEALTVTAQLASPVPPIEVITQPKAEKPVATITVQPVSVAGPLTDAGIVIHGSGYGHGMGLSQWGAKTLAERGKRYDEILTYFYSGVQLSKVQGDMRVVSTRGGAAKQPKATQPEESEEATPVFYTPFAEGR